MYRLTKAIVEFIGYEFAIFIALYGSVATDIKITFSILIDTVDIVTFYTPLSLIPFLKVLNWYPS